MQFDGVPNTIPQLEEGITEVSWKSKDDSIRLAQGSYPSILSVFNTEYLPLTPIGDVDADLIFCKLKKVTSILWLLYIGLGVYAGYWAITPSGSIKI